MAHPVVCIDCAPLLLRSAGVKTYLYHWMTALRELSPGYIRTFLAPTDIRRLDHDGGPWKHPAKVAALIAMNRLPAWGIDAFLPRCDIFHISNQLRQPPGRGRLTATLHDLTPWIVPECHTPEMIAADKLFGEKVLRKADGIIAVSESTKRDAVRILGIDADRIRVIHLGVPGRYFNVTDDEKSRVSAIYRLARPYFLFVGTIEPRKNVDILLTAWANMPADFRAENDLVLAGAPGWRSEHTLNRLG